MKNFYRNYYQVITAIEENINERRLLPALILIYSAIDSLSWIAADSSDEPVNRRFKRWVNDWMLKTGNINCSAKELYSARCAVLHTFTPSQKESSKNRSIVYAFGNAETDKLDQAVSILSIESDYVSVHIEDLFWCFRNGFADYYEYALSDMSESKKFTEKAKQHFANIDTEIVDSLISLSNSKK